MAPATQLEHIRLAALTPLCLDQTHPSSVVIPGSAATVQVSPPPPEVYAADGTNNQEFLGIACGLPTARRWPHLLTPGLAVSRLVAWLTLQEALGHQCRNLSAFDGDEPWPGSPHGDLHLSAASAALYELLYQHDKPGVTGKQIDWFAIHFAGMEQLTSLGGVFAAPCGRALSLPPQWIFDRLAYAVIVSREDLATAKKKHGDVAPPSRPAFDLLMRCSAAFPTIRQRMSVVKVKRATPVRVWRQPDGGFTAIMVRDSGAIYKPCAGVQVDGAGNVKAVAKIAEMPVPSGTPEVIGE